jgi:CheY-like chemotaxis protein
LVKERHMLSGTRQTVTVYESVAIPHIFLRSVPPLAPGSVASSGKKISLPVVKEQPLAETRYLRSQIAMSYAQRFQNYNTADFLVVDDDEPCRTILKSYISRIRVRSQDPMDEGRNLVCETAAGTEEVLRRVLKEGQTFAAITVDNYMGSQSASGRDLIRQLRAGGYEGALVYITGTLGVSGDLESRDYERHLMEVGADALLVKGSATMKSELQRIVSELVVRDFEPRAPDPAGTPNTADTSTASSEEEGARG